MKTCNVCDVEKPLEGFHRSPQTKDGRINRCKPCAASLRDRTRDSENRKVWHRANRDAVRNSKLKSKYGITLDDFNAMLEQQGGVCAICSNPETTRAGRDEAVRSLCVDHDHATGAVRGLLCSLCNSGIGKLNDSVETLEAAITYLRTKGGR